MENKIKINELCKSYFRPNGKEVIIFNHLNIEFESNKITCILGKSGCGKSTLIDILSGLEQPTSGCVEINDEIILDPIKNTNIIFQKNILFPWKTVANNLKFALRMKNYSKDKINLRVNKFLKYIGMEDIVNRYPKELSGGMQQRIALVRALITKPEIVILDESFGALDVITRYEMQKLFLDFHEKLKFTAMKFSRIIKICKI